MYYECVCVCVCVMMYVCVDGASPMKSLGIRKLVIDFSTVDVAETKKKNSKKSHANLVPALRIYAIQANTYVDLVLLQIVSPMHFYSRKRT